MVDAVFIDIRVLDDGAIRHVPAHLLQVAVAQAEAAEADIAHRRHRNRAEHLVQHPTVDRAPVRTGDHRVEAETDREAERHAVADTREPLGEDAGPVLIVRDDVVRRQREGENVPRAGIEALPEALAAGLRAYLNAEIGVRGGEFGPGLHVATERLDREKVRVVGDAEVDRMLAKQGLDLREDVLQIQENHEIPGRVHALQVTVLAVEQAVHHRARVVEVLIAHALAHRRARIDGAAMLHREDQRLRAMLRRVALVPPVEDILVVLDRDAGRPRKVLQNLLRPRPPARILVDRPLNVDM